MTQIHPHKILHKIAKDRLYNFYKIINIGDLIIA